MALPTNADVIVVHGYWLDELTGAGVKQANGLPATIMFDPVPLLGANATKTPNLRDLTSNAHLKTRTRVATVDPVTGYYAAQLVASNDPDLDAYSGRKVTFLGEDPFTIEVPYNAPTVTVSTEMAAKTGLTQGSSVKAIWLPNASVTTIPTPTPAINYLSSSQTLANIAAGIETHDEDPTAHADIRALIGTPYTDEQARDTLAAALVAGSNVTITPNDGADTITISVSVPSSYSDEQAQDAFAALIAAGTHSGITFAYNDAGNAISATVAAQTWNQVSGKPTFAAVATSGSASDITTGTLPDGVIPAGIARDTEVATAVANLVNSAPGTLDTLGEIATALQADESAAATLTATVGGKASAFTQSATKTANYTAADNEIVPLDTSGGTFTLTGPASGKPFGFRWKAGATAPTIAAPSGYTISGAASVTPGLAPSTSSGELVLWQAFGTDYQPISGFKPQTALQAASDARYPVLDGSSKVPAGNMRAFNDRGVVAASTSYNPWDTLIYQARRILITNATTSNSGKFISAANYVQLGEMSTFNAYDYGYRADGSTGSAAGNTAALKQAIADAAAAGGGTVEVPAGYGFIAKDGSNPWAIELQSNVWLRGQGMKATQVVLAPTQDCTLVKIHTSTGSGNPNAFYCGVLDLTLDGRKSTQTNATGSWHGIDATTNPLTTAQTGDDGFDAHHLFANLRIYFCAGDAVHLAGRSAIVLQNIFAWACNGYGFNLTFDTRVEDSEASQCGLAGFRIVNGQVQVSNSKSYLNGTITASQGHGFLLANPGLAGCSLSGCVSQNNTAHGFYFNGATGCAVTGAVADTNNTSNSSYVGFAFDAAASNNVLTGVSSQTGQDGVTVGYQSNALAVTGSATANDIILSHYAGASQTVGTAVASGSTVTGNKVVINSTAINPVPEFAANKGQPSGYAPLDSTGVVPSANLPAASGGTPLFFGNGFFGDGSDGSATLDGTNTVSWATKSGSLYTLTQNINVDTLSISAGASLKTSTYVVNVKTALTGSGSLVWNGQAANSASGGFGALGVHLRGGVTGGAGTSSAGSAGNNQTGHTTHGGAGGAGGTGSPGASGAGGTALAALASNGGYSAAHSLPAAAQAYSVVNAAILPMYGGAGGGGGGGDGTNSGGGGGGGAGVMLVNAKTVSATLTFSTVGGNGFTPTTGNCGGGGGGGGGLIIVNTTSITGGSSPTLTAAGGAGGSGVGTGTAGATGSAGRTYLNVFA